MGEELGRLNFRRRYELTIGPSSAAGELADPSFPDPVDWGGLLTPSHRGSQSAGAMRVDVIVCVHNALTELRVCLWSLLAKTARPFHLILVNDGSDEATQAFLETFAARHPVATLISNAEPPHGYTIAANLGLDAAGGDLMVLLNSDTIVSFGWLDGLVECMEANPTCGVAGPLSNAATHQSIPRKREGDAWAVNELPQWLTPDGMALLLRMGGRPARPRLPFLNGFCFAIRREALEAVGNFDQERFQAGYCEENDYCVRAGDAGFELVVADDCYVHHAKASSYGATGRLEHAREHMRRFVEKHGEAHVRPRIDAMDNVCPIDAVRDRVLAASSDPESARAAFRDACPDPLRVAFVVPNMSPGGSGGLHSIYQETSGMRKLGIDAAVLLRAGSMDHARAAYENADELFLPYTDEDDLERLSRGRDVLVATHFKSVPLVARIRDQRDDFLPAYYVQDYEPFFGLNVNGGTPDSVEASASYQLVPDMLLFAKTHWLCNVVGRMHGIPVAKVEPSIDEALFTGTERPPSAGAPVRVTAMVRPRTWRRQPFTTLMLLDRLKSDLGTGVEVVSFGCTDADLDRMLGGRERAAEHLGLLTRERVAALLGSADLFLDFSVFQAMGRTGFEAMACGCAAVLPVIGGAHEFAIAGENALLVDPFDPEAAYAALRELIMDRDRLGRMQEAGRRTARRRSVLAAVYSEYALFEHEHARRFGRRGGRYAASSSSVH